MEEKKKSFWQKPENWMSTIVVVDFLPPPDMHS